MPENLPVISRPRDGAMLGGVCAGLARRSQLDPNLLRIAVVILAVFGGLGFVAYGAGLLLMPRDGQSEMPLRRYLPFTRTWSTAGVVALTGAAALAVIAAMGSQGVGPGPLVILFCVWFFGFRGRTSRLPAPPPEPTPYERAAENWRHRMVERQTPGYEATATAPATAAGPAEHRWTQPYTNPTSDLAVRDDDLPMPAPQPEPRPRSWRLWWLALVLVGAAVLAVTLLGFLGLPATPLAYAAAALGALGLTLLAGTRAGRPPLLLPATLVAAMVTGGLLLGAHRLTLPTVGEQHFAYTAVTDLPPSLELGVGELTVDLSRLDLTADRTLQVHVGTGQLNLVVPEDVATEVTWRVKSGEYNAAGLPASETQDGFDLAGSTTYSTPAGSSPVLRITASVDLGELDVTR